MSAWGIMLTLILINVQYLQKDVFSLQKGLNGQNHSSSGPHHPIKKNPPTKFPIPPPFNTIWKTLQSAMNICKKPIKLLKKN